MQVARRPDCCCGVLRLARTRWSGFELVQGLATSASKQMLPRARRRPTPPGLPCICRMRRTRPSADGCAGLDERDDKREHARNAGVNPPYRLATNAGRTSVRPPVAAPNIDTKTRTRARQVRAKAPLAQLSRTMMSVCSIASPAACAEPRFWSPHENLVLQWRGTRRGV
jgi:hypothetical protein